MDFNRVVSDEDCNRYKITFTNYLAYFVRDETFTVWNDEEKFIGYSFRKYSKSNFLDYLQSSTNIDYAKNFMSVNEYFHFGFCCENHIIDIASSKEPLIEKL